MHRSFRSCRTWPHTWLLSRSGPRILRQIYAASHEKMELHCRVFSVVRENLCLATSSSGSKSPKMTNAPVHAMWMYITVPYLMQPLK